ncbi:MAG: AarF/UbiB family protein [Myxococcota bacterium]
MSNPTDVSNRWLDAMRDLVGRTAQTVRQSLAMADRVVQNAAELVAGLDRDARSVARDAVQLWATVAEAGREMQAHAQATPRMTRVLGEVVRLAGAYRLYNLKAPFLAPEAAKAALDATHRREAARVRAFCEELGGGVLKVGQFLSCRADLLPEPWLAELSLLQDRVPPEPPEVIAAFLEAELGGPLAEKLPGFDVTPIAAASLAEVHVARLPDGTPVAVKVQRPGIAEVIATDRRALSMVAELLASLVPQVDGRTVARELARSLEDELDYRAEADHAEAFAAALGHLGVIVPRIHREVSTGRVLVMELVEAERLNDFLLGSLTREGGEAQREKVLETLARATAEAVLVHGLIHADPHPGNFLVASDARLVLLDFGAVARLTDDERRGYVELLPLVFAGDVTRATALVEKLGFAADDPAVPMMYVREVVASVLASQDLSTIDPRAEMERGLALAQAHPGLKVPAHFVQLGRSLAGLAGLFFAYKPKLALGRIMLETLVRAAAVPPPSAEPGPS